MTASPKSDIRSLQLDELRLVAQPSYRARQITDWLYEKRVNFRRDDRPAANPGAKLADDFSFDRPEVVRVLGSKDTTRKFLFRLSDGNLIESVLIPGLAGALRRDFRPPDRLRFDPGRLCLRLQILRERAWTVSRAISSRTRSSISCSRSKRESGEKIDNIVFMGMGEPLANLRNLLRAIRIINAPWGLGIGARHITISTSGLAPQIRKLAIDRLQFRLAISLHGATDEVRSQIMPVNRKYNLATLLRPATSTSRKRNGSCLNTSLSRG